MEVLSAASGDSRQTSFLGGILQGALLSKKFHKLLILIKIN